MDPKPLDVKFLFPDPHHLQTSFPTFQNLIKNQQEKQGYRSGSVPFFRAPYTLIQILDSVKNQWLRLSGLQKRLKKNSQEVCLTKHLSDASNSIRRQVGFLPRVLGPKQNKTKLTSYTLFSPAPHFSSSGYGSSVFFMRL